MQPKRHGHRKSVKRRRALVPLVLVFVFSWCSAAWSQVDTGSGDYVDDQGLPAEYIYNAKAGYTEGDSTPPEISTGTGDFLENGLPVRYIFKSGFGIWKGTGGTTWSSSANWYNGLVPTSLTGTKDIVIPNTGGNDPIIGSMSADMTLDSLRIESGAKLTVASTGALKSLVVNGAVTVAGSMAVGIGGELQVGTMIMRSGGRLDLTGTGSLKVNNLTATGATVNLSGTSAASPATVAPLSGGLFTLTVNDTGSGTMGNFLARYATLTETLVDVNSSGTVSIDDVIFDKPWDPAITGAAHSLFLDLAGYTGTATMEFENVTFDNSTRITVAARNIKGATTAYAVVINYSGDLAGETFDDDGSNRVIWIRGIPDIQRSGGGTGSFTSISKGLAGAVGGGGDTLDVRSNIPHYGPLDVTKDLTVKRAVILGDVTFKNSSGTAVLENAIIKGNVSNQAGSNFTLTHCTVDGNITNTGGTATLNFTLYTGSLTGTFTQTQNYRVGQGGETPNDVFFNPAGNDYHLRAYTAAGTTNPTVYGVIAKVIASGDDLVTGDFESAGTRATYPKDIGADESSGLANAFYYNVYKKGGAPANEADWVTFGSVNDMGWDTLTNQVMVSTGPVDKAAPGANDWPNSLVFYSGATGEVRAGINGGNTAFNVGFSAAIPAFEGPVHWVYISYDWSANKYLLYAVYDRNNDGLTDSIRKISVPWTYPGEPLWADAATAVVWTTSFGTGPISRVGLAQADTNHGGIYPLLVVSDKTDANASSATADTSPNPTLAGTDLSANLSAIPTLFKLDPRDGGLLDATPADDPTVDVSGSKNSAYTWNSKVPIAVLAPNGTFVSMKSGAAADLARIDDTGALNTVATKDFAGVSGLDQMPLVAYYGSSRVFTATANDEVHSFNVSNFADSMSWGLSGKVDLGVAGVTSADNVGTNSAALGIAYQSNYAYGGIAESGDKNTIYKLAITGNGSGTFDSDWTDTDWTIANTTVYGDILTPIWNQGGRVAAVSRGGFLHVFNASNTVPFVTTGDDGVEAPGFPLMLPGGYAVAVRFWQQHVYVAYENGRVARYRWR